MIETLHVVLLAIIQGLTEFLPVSSSAHLILLPKLLGWQDQGLSFDIAVHLGTLVAVIFYFRHQLRLMTKDWVLSVCGKGQTSHSKLMWAVGFGTIPVGLCGLMFKSNIESLRSPLVIAYSTIGFGLILGLACFKVSLGKNEQNYGWLDVLFIGMAQALALIPGTSRSGITMTAALLLGFEASAAARYSFLLGIPVILLAGMLEFISLYKMQAIVDWAHLALSFVISAIFGYLCVKGFLTILQKVGMLPFVIYRLLLGSFLCYLF